MTRKRTFQKNHLFSTNTTINERHNAMNPLPIHPSSFILPPSSFVIRHSSFVIPHQPIITTHTRSRAVTIPPKKPGFPRENGGTPAREREKPSYLCNVAGATNPRTAKNAGKRALFALEENRANRRSRKIITNDRNGRASITRIRNSRLNRIRSVCITLPRENRRAVTLAAFP